MGTAMPGSGIILCLFGVPSIDLGGNAHPLTSSAARLSAYLALGPRSGRIRSVAAAHLYPDSPPPLARRRLNTAAWRLNNETRAAYGDDLIVTPHGSQTIGIDDAARITVDVWAFSDLVGDVVRLSPHAITVAEVERLEQAVDLYRGRLAPTVEDEWVLGARARVENLYLIALSHLVRYYGTVADVEGIARLGERALDVEPVREDIHRALMRAYAASGRQDLVESQFERCRITLQRVLQVAPMPQTVELFRRLAAPTDFAREEVNALLADLNQARRDLTRVWVRLDSVVERVQHLR
ncbi:BTAD domain-containing putative transcriptional regulator [Nocardioides sp. GCM10030258]|uniref:AfsR/SARP family transcriptional regulator n=1 Tax=unclassified Nocardioides TaxID=2615069 RepID=UPI00361128EA